MRSWHPPTGRSNAILVPPAAAGALFALSTGAFVVLDSNAPKAIDPDKLAMTIPVLLLVTVPGFVLASLPMVLGVVSMHWLGRWNFGLRHPAAWGLAGGGLTGAALALAGMDFPASHGLAPGFVATGTLCALLARAFVRWPAPSRSDRGGPE